MGISLAAGGQIAIMSFPESIFAVRLLLRKYCATDAPAIAALVHPDRERLLESFADVARGLRTAAQSDAYVADKALLWEQRKTFCYGLWRRSDGALVGQLQVKNIAWTIPSAELSYFIGREHLRQGYASEAIETVLREALETQRFERIYLRIIASNHESLLLASKLGFVREGLHRKEFRCGHGLLHDVHYFSRLRP
jgi:RimJ/RimL family protein N-acetyltransferase